MTTSIHSLLPLLLPAPLPAQETAPTPPTTAAVTPPLVIETDRADVATMLAMTAFRHRDELPEVADGEHYVLTLGADKKLSIATAKGDVGLCVLTADPGALMDAFGKELEENLHFARGGFTLGMQQAGLSAKEAAGMFADLVAFPRQIASVRLEVRGDPEAMEEGFDVVFATEAKAGSAFAGVVEKLAPSSQGAPKVGGAPGLLDAQVSIAPDGLAALFAPARTLFASMTAGSDEQRARTDAMFSRWMALYDGGMSLSVGGMMQYRMLMGTLDGDAVRTLIASEEYRAMAEGQRLPDRDMELEVTPDAVQHRGVSLVRSRITGGEPSPMMPEGEVTSLTGAVANYIVLAMGGDTEAVCKQLIDAVVDGKVARAPLEGGALLHATLDVRGFAKMFAASAGARPPGDDVPASAEVVVTRSGRMLRVATHVK